MAESRGIPILASGDVRCADPQGRTLLDALTCLHEKTTLDEAGRRLLINGERHLHKPEAVIERFRDHPEWILATRKERLLPAVRAMAKQGSTALEPIAQTHFGGSLPRLEKEWIRWLKTR